MSASEMRWRISDHVKRRLWVRRQVVPGISSRVDLPTTEDASASWTPVRDPAFRTAIAEEVLEAVPGEARQGVPQPAGRCWLDGGSSWHRASGLGGPGLVLRSGDGTRAPQFDYCFKVNHRSEDVTGNVEQIWELSRMHHVTVLAAAFALSGDERYAERAAAHLRSWWAKYPFLSGVHWTSGIEAGLRLISWVWVRRLLDAWDGAAELFEDNEMALAQIGGISTTSPASGVVGRRPTIT